MHWAEFSEVIWDWLEARVSTKIYEYSSVSTSGTSSFFTYSEVSGIKRSKYTHEVTHSALVSLANDELNLQFDHSDYSQWKENLERESIIAN